MYTKSWLTEMNFYHRKILKSDWLFFINEIGFVRARDMLGEKNSCVNSSSWFIDVVVG